jgi:hypothetical protein
VAGRRREHRRGSCPLCFPLGRRLPTLQTCLPPQRSRLRASFRDGCPARGPGDRAPQSDARLDRGDGPQPARELAARSPPHRLAMDHPPGRICMFPFLPGLFFPCGSAGLAGGPRPAEVGAVAPNPMHDDGRACTPAPRWPGVRHGGGRPPSPRPSARTIARPGSARPVRLPRRGREVPRQHPPLAAGLQQGEDRGHHPPQARQVVREPPARARRRQRRREQRPLPVRHVACIGPARTPIVAPGVRRPCIQIPLCLLSEKEVSLTGGGHAASVRSFADRHARERDHR